MEETTLRSLIDTVKSCSDAGKRYCFILGAGASRASGIKTGAEMAKEWIEELEVLEKESTQEWTKEKNIDKEDIGSHYSKIYGRRFRLDPASGFIRLQNEMEKAIPSPGYYHLAEIIDKTQNKLVITTNFDSLTEDSLFIYRDKKALVITHESLAKYIDALTNRPTVIKLHRDLLLHPKSNEADVNTLSVEWRISLEKIMDIYIPIVIGYGGNDGSLMGFLGGSVASKDRIIYWCHKRDNQVNEEIKELLEKYRSFLVPIDNFDDTMQNFGACFGFQLDKDTTRKNTHDRADKLIDKYYEWTKNRRETLKTSKTLSDTESMTFESFESLSKRNISELKKRIANNPKKAYNYYSLGNVYYFKGEYNKAIEYLTKAIDLEPKKPKNAKYCYSRGINYIWLKEYDKAIADYSKAIKLEDDNAKYYDIRGKIYNSLKEYDKAIADHSKAIKLEDDNAKYYLSLARTLCSISDFDRAHVNLNTAMSLKRELAECYNVCGFIDLKKAKHEKVECESDVLNDLNNAIELSKDDSFVDQGRFHADRAEYYLYSNEPDKAYNDIKTALDFDVKYGRAYFFKARYYKIKGNDQKYERYMTEATELRYIPDDSDY